MLLALGLAVLFAVSDRLHGWGTIKGTHVMAAFLAIGGMAVIHPLWALLGGAWVIWRNTPKVPFANTRLDPGTPYEIALLFARHVTLAVPMLLAIAWGLHLASLAALIALAWAAYATACGVLVRFTAAPGRDMEAVSEGLRGAGFGLAVFAITAL